MQKQLLSAAFVSLLLVAPAAAKAVRLPEGKPQVSVDIPDDWTVTFDAAGLQAVSPETNSFVYGKVLKRSKDDANKWVAEVLAKLQARGVVFPAKKGAPAAAKPPASDAEAKPVASAVEPKPAVAASSPAATLATDTKVATVAPAAVPPAASPPTLAVAPTVPPAIAGVPASSPAAPSPTAPSVDVKAAPALPEPASRPVAPPVVAGTQPAPPPPNLSMPSLALLNEGPPVAIPEHKGPRFPFHALPYKDTSLNGTPVDVELLTFILPDKSVFFLVQESGQTDPRMTEIINSVKPPQ